MCIRDSNRTYHNEFHSIADYLNRPEILKQLSALKSFAVNNYTVRDEILDHDWIVSNLEEISFILANDVPVFFAYGDKDLIVNYRGGYSAVESVEWAGKEQFKNTPWEKLDVNHTIYGLFKKYSKLRFYFLYGAGHFIAKDQPFIALHLLTEFIKEVI
eukprot:TRINITY_DN1433_c0_g1_i1.p1 TRINITY_DN1433_c0_g1~~TRINITY_DN1433_c0_g1_i1.p1  ORF type:complete len:179 (+),score=13.49 TRINITY_DN1433_c0_g1_i1:65-538(+)